MNRFEERWRLMVRSAHRAPPDPVPEMPHGLAARVMARARAERAEGGTWLRLIEWVAVRGVAGIGLLVCIAGVLHASDLLATPSIVPAIENTVAERFPLL